MAKMRLTLFVVSLVVAGGASADGLVSPYLRLCRKSAALRKAAEISRCAGRPVMCPRSVRLSQGVYVKTTKPRLLIRQVESLGGRAGKPVGDIVPVSVTLEQIDELAQVDGVVFVEGRPPRKPLLDISRSEVGADLVEQGAGDLPAYDGRGVLVGLVDTGVDYHHADFDTDGSRVRLIWDQFLATGEPPPGQTEGALCDRQSILRGRCNSVDLVGHGTHVAATMASSSERYRGMAPAAGIMAVASVDFTMLVESVQWLFEQAEQEGRPMVINLSLGGHYGPHDGTSLESQALSGLTGPGRIIVAAAGNEGSDFIHLGYDPQGGQGDTLFDVYSGMDVSAALFTVWHAKEADLEFSIAVRRAGEEIARTDFVSAHDGYRQFDLADGPVALGKVQFQAVAAANPENGKFQLDILVEPSDAAFSGNPQGYEWIFSARGTGPFDAWSAATGYFTPPARFSNSTEGGLMPGDNEKTVGMPAVAPGIIAVASYATKDSWTDAEGKDVSHPETTPGQISFFSSRGPSADPERTGPKPTVAAPGEYIVAALSRNAGALEQGTLIDDEHIAMRGTSMACPHVAGVVALMLQANPLLDPAGVERALELSSRRDEATGPGPWDPQWGFGKLNAPLAVATAAGVGACEWDEDCTEGLVCQDGMCREPAGCGCSPSRGGKGIGTSLVVAIAILVLAHGRGRRKGRVDS